MTTATRYPSAALAAHLRPALVKLTRLIRSQRVDTGVTITQLSALYTLNMRGPLSAGELASAEKVQPPSMTKVIASLEEGGLVTREPHATDRRQVVVSITAAGQELLAAERQTRDAWLARRLATLTPQERALLHNVVPILGKLAEQ